ncbi:hypothetical protein [Streptomyces uncialis]|uniref:hypothetical protein n=1 Tax=Streptomyces uncialis TaxID=1048205 RepID=UPI003401AF37
MRSEARARRVRAAEGLTTEEGAGGDLYEGADLPPGSNRLSPCRCPQHCPTAPEDEATRLSAAVREVNERSRGKRW